MFQAGKLRKDRQLALEKIGLKWSMLATTSWESMFETLCQYVKEKKKDGAEWDGNVPANYRTEDVPPRALGRWINRQRSAYGKSKLKPEYVVKLNKIGLKWSIHERRPTYHQYTSRPVSSTKVPELVKSTIPEETSSTAQTQDSNMAKPQSEELQIKEKKNTHPSAMNKDKNNGENGIDEKRTIKEIKSSNIEDGEIAKSEGKEETVDTSSSGISENLIPKLTSEEDEKPKLS